MFKMEDINDVENQINDLETETNDLEDNLEEYETWLEDITYEQASKWKDDLKKASKKIAELKNQLKTKINTTNDELVTKNDLAIDKFLIKNPDLEDYKDELTKYTKMWFSLDKAKLLVENDDKTIENRRKSNSLNITDWDIWNNKTITRQELENLSPKEYIKIRNAIDDWKIKVK